MVEAMDRRHLMYNRQLDYVAEAERQGRCLVIRPDGKLPIGHVSHDPEQMERVYQTGRQMGERKINEIKEILCE
jgi:predicted patatin/cPLA2 family phospholipase